MRTLFSYNCASTSLSVLFVGACLERAYCAEAFAMHSHGNICLPCISGKPGHSWGTCGFVGSFNAGRDFRCCGCAGDHCWWLWCFVPGNQSPVQVSKRATIILSFT